MLNINKFFDQFIQIIIIIATIVKWVNDRQPHWIQQFSKYLSKVVIKKFYFLFF